MRLICLLVLLTTKLTFGQQNFTLRFIENKGQWPTSIDFQAQVPGGRIGVSPSGFDVYLLDLEAIEHQHLHSHDQVEEATGVASQDHIHGHYFRINLLGSNTQAKASPGSVLDGYYNFYIGKKGNWVSKAKAYGVVVYRNVYTGIDLRVSSLGSNLKYDFIVAPGADPAQIKIQYSGTFGISKPLEDLEISTSVGILSESKPYTYQVKNGSQQAVICGYKVDGNTVSFDFPESYDPQQELVIDPLLIFSTYSGSTADNWGSTATPGEHGTLYSAGVTRGNLGGSFPATTGAFQTFNQGNFDMGIIKYDSAGTRFLYATYLGGNGNDSPQSLVVDPISNDLIVLGISSSPDFPTSVNAFDNTFNFGTTIFNRVLNTNDQWDIVLTRLSSTGDQLIGSTFLGGSGNDGLNIPKQSGGPLVVNYGDEMRGDVITDSLGNVYISSVTSSTDFPIINGADSDFNGGLTDGLLVKLAPNLSSILWSTYIGGSGFDAAYSLKFDKQANILLAGGTTSPDFPVTVGSYQTSFNGIVDGWIARISSDGTSIVNATFTGTASFDQVYFIDLNAAGNIYCYGQTAGHMPVTPGVYHNPNTGQFLQKFSPDLANLEFSTVFGAASPSGLVIPNISPTAFLVNDCNNIYMSGWGGFVNSSIETGFWQSSTMGMPVTNDAFQKTTQGSDFYFMVLNGDATNLVYSTFLGGNSSKTHVDGGTSRFDKFGIVYHAVCSGCAFGNSTGGPTSDFPTTPNAKSRFNLSANCNNAAFKFDLSTLQADFQTNNTALTIPGFNFVCDPDSIVFQNLSTGGRNITWDFDDGTIINQTNQDPRDLIHKFQQERSYKVKLKITDLSTCSQTDSITKTIYYYKPIIQVGEDAVICEGSTFQLTASGGQSYLWTNAEGTYTSSEQNPVIQPLVATTYYVTVADENGCSKSDTLHVGVLNYVRAGMETFNQSETQPGFNNACYPDPIVFKNLSTNGTSYTWTFNDGSPPIQLNSLTSINHQFLNQGTYRVKLKAINPNTCNRADSVEKVINYFKGNINAGFDAEICEGTPHTLTANGGVTYSWTTKDNSFASSQVNPTVTPTITTTYFLAGIDNNGCKDTDTVKVYVININELQWEYTLQATCTEKPIVTVRNLTTPQQDVRYQFDFGDGTLTDAVDVTYSYENEGTYQLRFMATNKFCVAEKATQLKIYKILVPNIFTPEASPGLNDTYQISIGQDLLPPYQVGIPVKLTVVDRWGKKVFEASDYRNDWNGQDLATGQYFAVIQLGDLATCKTWIHLLK